MWCTIGITFEGEPLPPKAEFPWSYQFYFATERGRAGYEKYRCDFNKLIWTNKLVRNSLTKLYLGIRQITY